MTSFNDEMRLVSSEDTCAASENQKQDYSALFSKLRHRYHEATEQ